MQWCQRRLYCILGRHLGCWGSSQGKAQQPLLVNSNLHSSITGAGLRLHVQVNQVWGGGMDLVGVAATEPTPPRHELSIISPLHVLPTPFQLLVLDWIGLPI